ncbi:uncharacterized protein mbpa isoform X6 [Notothenia coriiceps]|uniref:Uncharacterized protein mbpa isoform X6 n=1 Tax=Notothenia coriiceps TaxID=8208 RepID=A0A6I9NI14_9TELE|nr:PREDICTED: uncharacterized protein LOC104950006 isoform X6 [Notothenia coriiceps]
MGPPHPSSPPLDVGPRKMLWCISSGAWPRRRVPRAQSRRSGDAETKTHCPESSTCDALTRDQEKISPVHPLNAGAPSSKLSAEEQTTGPPPMGEEEEEEGETDLQAADSQPQEMLTH